MEKNQAQNVKLFQTPIHGLVNGQPVRITALGDVEGHSPSYLCIDTQGQSQWRSFSEVQVIDTNYLPLAEPSARTLSGGSRQNR